jgi:hypothetical protein
LLTLPAVAAEPAVSSSQLKWRPARPALATQSAEPGKIVQTAGTTELSGPSFLPAPSYNMTAQSNSLFDPAPTFPTTPAPATPGLTPPAPLNTPGLTPPDPLNTPSTVTPPAPIAPDALSQPMPPMTPGLVPSLPTAPGELPAPNLNNSGQMPLNDMPANEKPGGRDLMQEDCDRGRVEIKNTGLTQALSAQIVNLRYSGPGELPYECTVEATNFNGRSWGCLTYTWKASALCHKPLYFEEMSLERYGHSWGPICDPVVSAAHFFGTLPILPYKMGVDTPCECQYALGYYRPGNCAPYMIEPFPISARGAAVQAGFVTGAAAALP